MVSQAASGMGENRSLQEVSGWNDDGRMAFKKMKGRAMFFKKRKQLKIFQDIEDGKAPKCPKCKDGYMQYENLGFYRCTTCLYLWNKYDSLERDEEPSPSCSPSPEAYPDEIPDSRDPTLLEFIRKTIK